MISTIIKTCLVYHTCIRDLIIYGVKVHILKPPHLIDELVGYHLATIKLILAIWCFDPVVIP